LCPHHPHIQLNADLPVVPGTPSAWLDDACLWRHLRARDYAVPAAVAAVRETYAWRQSFGVDGLMAAVSAAAPAASTGASPASDDANVQLVHAVSESGKQFVRGACAARRPILVMRPGRGVVEFKDSPANILQLVYSLERAVAAMPSGVEKLSLLIDFVGYSRHVSPSFAMQRTTLTILQHHYPERLGLAVMWAAPRLFHLAFKVIRPFIDPVTAGKIVFLYPDVAADAARMAALFDEGALLTDFGGSDGWVYSSSAYFGVAGGGGVLPMHMRSGAAQVGE